MLLTSEVMSLQGFSCACIEFCFTYLLQIRLSLLEKGFGSCMGVQAPPLPQCSAGYIYIYISIHPSVAFIAYCFTIVHSESITIQQGTDLCDIPNLHRPTHRNFNSMFNVLNYFRCVNSLSISINLYIVVPVGRKNHDSPTWQVTRRIRLFTMTCQLTFVGLGAHAEAINAQKEGQLR